MWRSATAPPSKLAPCQSCATYLRRPHTASNVFEHICCGKSARRVLLGGDEIKWPCQLGEAPARKRLQGVRLRTGTAVKTRLYHPPPSFREFVHRHPPTARIFENCKDPALKVTTPQVARRSFIEAQGGEDSSHREDVAGLGIMRHRQTKEPETDRPDLTHRATSRLDIKLITERA
jgi:hypothetical protein